MLTVDTTSIELSGDLFFSEEMVSLKQKNVLFRQDDRIIHGDDGAFVLKDSRQNTSCYRVILDREIIDPGELSTNHSYEVKNGRLIEQNICAMPLEEESLQCLDQRDRVILQAGFYKIIEQLSLKLHPYLSLDSFHWLGRFFCRKDDRLRKRKQEYFKSFLEELSDEVKTRQQLLNACKVFFEDLIDETIRCNATFGGESVKIIDATFDELLGARFGSQWLDQLTQEAYEDEKFRLQRSYSYAPIRID